MEIEVKFLLYECGKVYVPSGTNIGSIFDLQKRVKETGVLIEQGYFDENDFDFIITTLDLEINFFVREIRLRKIDSHRFITLKGEGGLSREEVELPITDSLFDELWPKTLSRRIIKRRLEMMIDSINIEVDLYLDRDLMIAEIELKSEGDSVSVPVIGKNVTNDPKYRNRNLAINKMIEVASILSNRKCNRCKNWIFNPESSKCDFMSEKWVCETCWNRFQIDLGLTKTLDPFWSIDTAI